MLRLAGAVVEADHVDIDTGALTVQSLQDEAYSKSRSYGLNIGFGFGAGTNESGGLTTAMTSGSGGLGNPPSFPCRQNSTPCAANR